MKSRVHLKYKTKYHVGNWSEYERALVQRGDVIVWLSADATNAWKPSPSGRPGGQRRFSDLAIETALTLRLAFRLPFRQTEGFLRSVLALLSSYLDAPDHTTLSRRSQRFNVKLQGFPVKGPIHLIVDSTGLSIVGEGEWAAVKHGRRSKRGWVLAPVAVDRHLQVEIGDESTGFAAVGDLFGSACVYGQVLKTRRNNRVIRVERRVKIGTASRLKAALWASEDSETLNTSFVERLNLTIRQASA